MKRNKDQESDIESYQEAEPVPNTVLFVFEDFSIVRVGTEYAIEKLGSGISDSTYAMSAMGKQKNWQLYNEYDVLIDTGNQHGNRKFSWQGSLPSGLYTLETGVPPKIKDLGKHRTPGRSFRITFRV